MTPEIWLLTVALLSSRPGFVTAPWMQTQYEFPTEQACTAAIKNGQFEIGGKAATEHNTALAVYCVRKGSEVKPNK